MIPAKWCSKSAWHSFIHIKLDQQPFYYCLRKTLQTIQHSLGHLLMNRVTRRPSIATPSVAAAAAERYSYIIDGIYQPNLSRLFARSLCERVLFSRVHMSHWLPRSCKCWRRSLCEPLLIKDDLSNLLSHYFSSSPSLTRLNSSASLHHTTEHIYQ